MTKTPDRIAGIDWLKCLGMLVIVYGHTAGRSVLRATEPFNPKQLGVVFFVLVMGFSLAREQRPRRRVVYARAFDICLIGLLSAILVSSLRWLTGGDPNPSNYLPLMLGANVVFNSFPANPTTWYIGTYLHLLLIWAVLLRGVRVRLWMIAASLLIEIPVRVLWMLLAGDYVAYMLVTNWLSILLLGMYLSQQARPSRETPAVGRSPDARRCVPWFTALVVLATVWPLMTAQINLSSEFPFTRLQLVEGAVWVSMFTSASITLLYFLYGCLTYGLVTGLPDLPVVRFFARNTLIVFVGHMPLYYLIAPAVHAAVPPGFLRAALNVAIYYVALAGVSEALLRLVPLRRLREAVAVRLFARHELATQTRCSQPTQSRST